MQFRFLYPDTATVTFLRRPRSTELQGWAGCSEEDTFPSHSQRLVRTVVVSREQLVFMGIKPKWLRIYEDTTILQNSVKFSEGLLCIQTLQTSSKQYL